VDRKKEEKGGNDKPVFDGKGGKGMASKKTNRREEKGEDLQKNH